MKNITLSFNNEYEYLQSLQQVLDLGVYRFGKDNPKIINRINEMIEDANVQYNKRRIHNTIQNE